MVDRTALRRAYRPDENRIVEQRLAEAALSSTESNEALAIARSLSKAVRAHFIDQRAHHPDHIKAAGYWQAGSSDFDDGHAH